MESPADSRALLDKARLDLRRATAARARNKRERNLAAEDPIRTLILREAEPRLRANVVVARIKFDIVKDLLDSGEPLAPERFDEIVQFMVTVARTFKAG